MSHFGAKLRNQSKDESTGTWKKVMEFYQNEFLCDIKLTVGYESRCAHRVVLSTLCPNGPWSKQEVRAFSRCENDLVQLDVSDLFKTPQIFTSVIDFIYMGTIRLKTETVLQILEVAIQLNLTDLIILCSQFLLEHIRIKNVLSLWNLAHEMNLRQLAEVCRVLTRELLKDVLVDSNDMKLLSVDFMEMLLDQKYVTDTLKPTEIVRFILKWLIEDTKERLQTARAFLPTVEICQSELLQVCDSVCENHEIMKASTLKEMLRDCCPSPSNEAHPQETVAIKGTPEPNTETAPFPENAIPNSRNDLDRDGCRVLMVRDAESTTVFCQKTQTWLKFPNITYQYIVGFSDRKFLACTKKLFSRSFQIIDFTRLHQPGSIEERRLIDDIFPDPKYIWYLCNGHKWYLASLIINADKYNLILHQWDDINGVFNFRCNFPTSLPIYWVIKEFTYFNDDGYSLILIIVTRTNLSYQSAKIHDLFYLFRVNWNETIVVEEVLKDTFYHRCFILSIENFLYHDNFLYIFDLGLVKNLVDAIENNIPITIPAEVYDLRLKNDNIHKSIQLPAPGLNILPLKPKSLQSQQVCDTQPTPSSNVATYSLDLDSDSSKSESFSKKHSCVSVIDKKLFLVAHRAPGIIQTFIVDIFEKSWKLTPPLPLAGLSEMRVNSFYSDCSLHKDFPAAKKSFKSEDFPMFEKWCLQHCQGLESAENSDNGSILTK